VHKTQEETKQNIKHNTENKRDEQHGHHHKPGLKQDAREG
jgi:hypothetical protein